MAPNGHIVQENAGNASGELRKMQQNRLKNCV
jgi:hypothetical protein